MNLLKQLLLVLICVLMANCTTIAHRTYACRETARSLSFSGFGWWFAGNVMQVGECSLTRAGFETGTYYSQRKASIDWYVQTDYARKYSGPEELHNFGRALNCSEEVNRDFSELVFSHKNEIFGSDFEHSGRAVALKIRDLIKSDPVLKVNCDI